MKWFHPFPGSTKLEHHNLFWTFFRNEYDLFEILSAKTKHTIFHRYRVMVMFLRVNDNTSGVILVLACDTFEILRLRCVRH